MKVDLFCSTFAIMNRNMCYVQSNICKEIHLLLMIQ